MRLSGPTSGRRAFAAASSPGHEAWFPSARGQHAAGAERRVYAESTSGPTASSLATPSDLVGRPQALDWLPRGAIVVHSAPPSPAGAEAERAVVAACSARDVRRIVYISSTGVYPPGDGGWITEDTPVAPVAGHGSARLVAESGLLEAAAGRGISAVSLRAAGIYGPGRGVHERLHAGTYRVIGAGDTYVNRIHVDDLVAIVVRAALIESLPRAVYNVADDEPETARVHADGVAAILGVAPAPSVPVDQVDARLVAMLGANRRIANGRVKAELGIELRYPTWREGLAQCLAEDRIVPAAGP